MLQSRAIKLISDKVQACGMVDGIYLSGDLAIEAKDASSDIHLHLVVDSDKYEAVLAERISYLEAYYTIMFVDEDFNTRIMRCVYDNGVIIYLYVIRFKDVKPLRNILIISDFREFLKNKMIITDGVSIKEIGDLINQFSFLLVEFYNQYRSDDSLSMLSSATKLAMTLGKFLRAKLDKENGRQGLKDIYLNLPEAYSKKYRQVVQSLKIDNLLEAVKMMMVIFDGFMNDMTIDLAEIVNIDMYLFTKERLWNL